MKADNTKDINHLHIVIPEQREKMEKQIHIIWPEVHLHMFASVYTWLDRAGFASHMNRFQVRVAAMPFWLLPAQQLFAETHQ